MVHGIQFGGPGMYFLANTGVLRMFLFYFRMRLVLFLFLETFSEMWTGPLSMIPAGSSVAAEIVLKPNPFFLLSTRLGSRIQKSFLVTKFVTFLRNKYVNKTEKSQIRRLVGCLGFMI